MRTNDAHQSHAGVGSVLGTGLAASAAARLSSALDDSKPNHGEAGRHRTSKSLYGSLNGSCAWNR